MYYSFKLSDVDHACCCLDRDLEVVCLHDIYDVARSKRDDIDAGATPQAIVERLHTALVDGLKSPQVAEILLKMGAPPEWSSPEQLRVFLRAEIRKFAAVIELAGAKID